MKIRLMLSAAVVATAIGTYAFAQQAGTDRNETRIQISHTSPAALTLCSATADKSAEEAPQPEHGVRIATSPEAFSVIALAGNGKLEGLIDELIESGDLTEAGAEKLREAIKPGKFFSAPAPNAFSLEGDGFWSEAPHAFAFGTGEPGTGLFDFEFKGDEDGKKLEIRMGEDGEVVVEGEGYTDEELAEIREKIQRQKDEGGPFMLFDAPLDGKVFDWSPMDGEHRFFFAPGTPGAAPHGDHEFFGDVPHWESYEEMMENLPKFEVKPDHPAPFFFRHQEFNNAFPHRFLFDGDHEGLREQVEQMVREILDEMGVEYSDSEKINTKSA